MIRLWWAALACTLVVLGGQAQDSNPSVEVPVVLDDDPELRAIDSMLVATYLNHFCFTADTSILNIFFFNPFLTTMAMTVQVRDRGGRNVQV